nr:restriction endonuclease subunit S [uncultured Ruminococcus sp.]
MAEQMKASGIAWIGDIPNDWSIKRIKYLANLKGRIGWQGLTSDEYTDEGPFLITGIDFHNGRINWNSCVHISESRWEEAPEIHIKNGDLLITKDGTVGKVAIVDGLASKASLNSGVLLIRTQPEYDKKFLFWVIQSEEFWRWFRLKNAGNSTIIHLYQGDFAEFSYTFPRISEQKAIADYLDKRCGEIDSIIADIEKQIELLKQYKKSLITETVTKGLDKSVPMKDSGIEWIGEIPSSWNVKKLKYICKRIGDIDHYMPDSVDEGIPYIMTGDFIGDENDIDFDNCKQVSLKDYLLLSNKIKVEYGDIILARYATIGVVRYVDTDRDFLVSYSCAIIKLFNDEMNSKYIFYYLKSSVFSEEIKEYINTNTQGNVGLDSIGRCRVTIPSMKDQAFIADYLDIECNKINAVIETKQQQLELMQQHKKSLIYEYVTGKKRVKEAM